MILSQSLESKGGNEVAQIHTLMAGMHFLQSLSVSMLVNVGAIAYQYVHTGVLLICPTPSSQAAQIARTLNVPVTRTQLEADKAELRLALNTTCNIRNHIESLEDLRQEMADDVEVNAMLVVLKHHQQDACHWVSVYTS